MNSMGDELINLTNDPGDDRAPSWSPDGNWIVFARNRDIYAIKVDGTEEVQLTYGEFWDWAPSWSNRQE